MAWNYNGYEVATILRIGNHQHGICESFDGYRQISEAELSRLPEQERASRVEAFYAHLSNHYGKNVKELAALNPEQADRRTNHDTCKPKEKPLKVSIAVVNGTVNGQPSLEIDVSKGDTCSIQSVANTNTEYKFMGWYKDDTLISTSENLSLVVNEHISIVAKYVAYLTVTVESDNASMGIADTSGANKVLPGDYVICKASPSAGYVFDGWYIKSTGTKISSNIEITYYPTQSVSLVAKFEIKGYYIFVGCTENQEEGDDARYYIQAVVGDEESIPNNIIISGNQWIGGNKVSFSISFSGSRSEMKQIYSSPANPDIRDTEIVSYTPSVASNGRAIYVS